MTAQTSGAPPRGPTLAAIALGAFAAAALALGALVFVVQRTSRAAVVDATERLCATASAEISRRAEDRLRAAEDVIAEFEAEARGGAVRTGDPRSVEAALVGAALRRPDVAEAAYTFGRVTGRDAEGRVVLAPDGRGQVAVERRIRAGGGLFVRRTSARGAEFVAEIRPVEGGAAAGAAVSSQVVADPTTHLTFVTPASSAVEGHLVWSDLHRSQLDAALPEVSQRTIVAAQKSVVPPNGPAAGVLRVSLTTERLDAIVRPSTDGENARAVFLCDRAGRLVAPRGATGRLVDTDDGLRVPPADVPPTTAAALALPLLRDLPPGDEARVAHFDADGRPFLAAFRALDATQDWIVGVTVPEDVYTADLERSRRRLVAWSAAVVAALLAGGALALRAAGRSFGAIVRETERMRTFDFAPAAHRASVREVRAVLDGIEHAKAALRALSKFVPVDLVRRLYADGREPRPGGELRELSILFSDIEGFTTLSESMAPGALAELMGDYFAAMTAAVHAAGGTVDKFVGDAVMALWNAPEPLADHAARACRAALACRDAERALQTSPAWAGRPRIRTRFGIHTGTVLVGNIGAPDRLNFTALGDGVNLASRLEGLNKHYGTTIVVSESVVAAAGPQFSFRRLDRVAVKGRAHGVLVHELLGGPGTRGDAAVRYEAALAAYFRREFAAARSLLAGNADDPAARVLAARCEAFAADPPPADWDGTSFLTEK
jgi:adenylate cyclase